MPDDIMKAPKNGVTVRMYRTGFGDCFLLAFPGHDSKPIYMLIDCGVHGLYTGGPAKIQGVVSHLRKTTSGHLDVLVITHEHADHISGFCSSERLFRNMDIDEAWFAWTEDPKDGAANALRERRNKMKTIVREVHKRMAADDQAEDGIGSLLGFFGMRNAD